MKILYLGDPSLDTTSRHRADALGRLGHDVQIVNTEAANQSRLMRWMHYRTGYLMERRKLGREVLARSIGQAVDLVWVNGGTRVSRQVLEKIRRQGPALVNYNNDDPTGSRDGRRWFTFRKALPAYDLSVVVRPENIAEYIRLGARHVLRVFMSYDPVAHAQIAMSAQEREAWKSEVTFVGAWMPERGPLICDLLSRGVPLTVRGNHWQKDPQWPAIKACHRPPALGRDYVAAIQGAKVGLGLLSAGNRDQHTQRSAEIPYIGTAICAQRTTEHQQMYTEGREALFFGDGAECARACFRLLADEKARAAIAAAGRQKVISLKLSNDEIIAGILTELRKVRYIR